MIYEILSIAILSVVKKLLGLLIYVFIFFFLENTIIKILQIIRIVHLNNECPVIMFLLQ